jgi:threonine dehydrogenase-like Zn-dependent dehydrogenase
VNVADQLQALAVGAFPTGYMAAEQAGIEPGDTVAVWGCGPVGQFAIKGAWMLKAGRVIAIDRVPERLRMAQKHGQAETIHFEKQDVYDTLMEMTRGRGPDRCIDAVGCEAHARGSFDMVFDRSNPVATTTAGRADFLCEAIMCCRKGGTPSVPGVYIGFPDTIPIGAHGGAIGGGSRVGADSTPAGCAPAMLSPSWTAT